MQIPENVRIGSCDYSVSLVEHSLTLGGKACYGLVDYEKHRIQIREAGDWQHLELTFLHEILHAIIIERNLHVENEELVVEEVGRGLYQVIRDNPRVFALDI